MDTFTESFVLPTALIFLGWLLGVLSPAIVELIRRERDSPLLRSAIKADLAELRIVLAFSAFCLRSGSGDLDRKYLEWTKNVLVTYNGSEEVKKSAAFVTTLLAAQDHEIDGVAKAWAATRAGGHSLKKFYAHTIDANLPTMWQLGGSLQTELLDISRRLAHVNEEVEQAQYYFRLTFECTGPNHDVARENLRSAYRNIADMACKIVDRIDGVRNL